MFLDRQEVMGETLSDYFDAAIIKTIWQKRCQKSSQKFRVSAGHENLPDKKILFLHEKPANKCWPVNYVNFVKIDDIVSTKPLVSLTVLRLTVLSLTVLTRCLENQNWSYTGNVWSTRRHRHWSTYGLSTFTSMPIKVSTYTGACRRNTHIKISDQSTWRARWHQLGFTREWLGAVDDCRHWRSWNSAVAYTRDVLVDTR